MIDGRRDDELSEAAEAAMAQNGEELAFDDGEERLPWLEADEAEEPATFDSSRLIGIGLLMLATLAVLIGGIWWFSNRGNVDGPEADGSLIAAPEEPFKTKPDDPGGKEFEGTGDTSFAVGEGQTREGRLADGTEDAAASGADGAENADPDARPSVATTQAEPTAAARPAPSPTPTPTSTPTQAAAPANPRGKAPPRGTAVQVGAFPTQAGAQAGWNALKRQTDALAGVDYRIVKGQADIGTVYRLQAATGSSAAAGQLCAKLKSEGLPCLVK
jgi:hypothetical protein